MTFTSTELTTWLGMYLWPLFRVAAMISIVPVLGAEGVPRRVKLLLAVTLTLVVAPVMPPLVAIDPLSLSGVAVIFQQIIIGMALGFVIRMVFGAFVLAGQLVGQSMGLGFASLIDPQNGVQVPVVSQFYYMIAVLIFVALDGHLTIIQVLVESFSAIPVGTKGLSLDALWTLALSGGWMFSAAVVISLPAVIALLLANVAFGVMTRAAPQLNVFSIGFPVMLLLGIVVLLFTLPSISTQLIHFSREGFELMRLLIRPGG